jgi:putative IMPACT (imprinted ancient) family translation regulator
MNMIEQDFYYTIEKTGSAEFKDRGSRFIALASPVASTDEFKQSLVDIKKLHPKATHHCFAYRLGVDGQTFRVSDDGEPSGTAGRPILGQIDSKGLVNVLVVVVRYFGGTLLGVPGRQLHWRFR